MKWLRRIGFALAAGLIALGFGMLGRPGRKLKKVQDQRDYLLTEGSRKAREEAVKAGALADKHQVAANEAAAVGQKAIDGVRDESMRELLNDFRNGGML